jgi:hypothetical protein
MNINRRTLIFGGGLSFLGSPAFSQRVNKTLEPEDLSNVELGVTEKYKIAILKFVYEQINSNQTLRKELIWALDLPLTTFENPGEFADLEFDVDNKLPKEVQIIPGANEKVTVQIGRTVPDESVKLTDDEVVVSIFTTIDNKYYNKYNRRQIEISENSQVYGDLIIYNFSTKKARRMLEEKKDL